MLHKKNIKKVIATWMAVVVSASCFTGNVSATEVSSANAVDGNVATDATTITPTVTPVTETIPNAVDASVMPVATREGDPAKMVAGYSMDPYSYFSEDEWEQIESNETWYGDLTQIAEKLQVSPYFFHRDYRIYMDFTSQAYRKNGKKVKKKINCNTDTYNNLMKYGLVKGDYIMVDGDVHMDTKDTYIIAITKEEFDTVKADYINKYVETYGTDEDPIMSETRANEMYGFKFWIGSVLFYSDGTYDHTYIRSVEDFLKQNPPFQKTAEKIYYYKVLKVDRTIKRSDRPDDPHFKGVTFKKDFVQSMSIPKEWKIKETVNKDGEYHAKCTIRKTFSARVCISFDMKTYWVDTGVFFPIMGYYSNGNLLENSFEVAYYGKPKLTKWEKSHIDRTCKHSIHIHSNFIPQKYKDLMAKRYSRK